MDNPLEKTITHHPLRTIELAYHRDRPQPDWEKETLVQYMHLHNEVWRLKTMREDYEPRLDRAISQITDIHRVMTPFVAKMGMLEAVVGLREAVHVHRPANKESVSINLNDFRQTSNRISDHLVALYLEITRATEEYNTFLKEFEVFDTWFEAFAEGPMHEIYHRYDEVGVDTVSLDNDHQGFLQAWQPIIWAEREYFDKARSAFNDYAELVDITNERFEHVTILDEALRDFTERNKQGKSGTINIRLTDDGEYHAF